MSRKTLLKKNEKTKDKPCTKPHTDYSHVCYNKNSQSLDTNNQVLYK